jgi:molybdate transport system substrate-binding protein
MNNDVSPPRKPLLTRRLATLVLGVALLTGCTSPAEPQPEATTEPVEITVSAAMTLKKVFEQLASEFETETGTRVILNFGASGVLQKQVEGGADVDVFASAAPRQMNELIEGGFVSVDATSAIASNEVVVLTRTGNATGITGARDLVALGRIATGNPESTPIGAAAIQWMEGQGLAEEFRSRVVYGENVTQVMEYLTRGEVDAVVVFASEAKGRDDVEITYTVPTADTPPIRYVIAPLASSTRSDEAAAFVEFVLSERGRQALADAGFLLLDPAQ